MVFRRRYFLLSPSIEKCGLINFGNVSPFSNVYANRSSSWNRVSNFRSGLKKGRENRLFWSEIGYGVSRIGPHTSAKIFGGYPPGGEGSLPLIQVRGTCERTRKQSAGGCGSLTHAWWAGRGGRGRDYWQPRPQDFFPFWKSWERGWTIGSCRLLSLNVSLNRGRDARSVRVCNYHWKNAGVYPCIVQILSRWTKRRHLWASRLGST